MKIALCISGYFSNKNGDDLLKSNYIYDNIINKCENIDILSNIECQNKRYEINNSYTNIEKIY